MITIKNEDYAVGGSSLCIFHSKDADTKFSRGSYRSTLGIVTFTQMIWFSEFEKKNYQMLNIELIFNGRIYDRSLTGKEYTSTGIARKCGEFQREILKTDSTEILDTLNKHREFCFKTFPTATAFSSLQKAKDEIEEIELDITFCTVRAEEYADAIFCIMDSANRAGLTPEIVFRAMAEKLKVNMKREWVDNGDGTYSHKKLAKEKPDNP